MKCKWTGLCYLPLRPNAGDGCLTGREHAAGESMHELSARSGCCCRPLAKCVSGYLASDCGGARGETEAADREDKHRDNHFDKGEPGTTRGGHALTLGDCWTAADIGD